MYSSNIYLHHYFQESQKVPQLSNFLTIIYTEPRYANVENNTDSMTDQLWSQKGGN